MAHVIAVAGKGGVGKTILTGLFEKQGLELLGVIPQDENVYQYDCDGKPIVDLPEDSPVREALDKIIRQTNQKL